jgi:hypothetical protein
MLKFRMTETEALIEIVITDFVKSGFSCRATAEALASDYGIVLSRQRVHQISQKLGLVPDPETVSNTLEPLIPDLVILRRLGFTLAQMCEYVTASTGIEPSESKLSRLLSDRSEDEMFHLKPKRSLIEFLEANKPKRKAALLDLYIDEILTMRKYGFTIDVICARLKEDRGIDVSPGSLTRHLMNYNQVAKPEPDADGKVGRRTRRQMTPEDLGREAENIERLRVAREQIERALISTVATIRNL